jgi:polyisoprenoid-binding protein YceI
VSAIKTSVPTGTWVADKAHSRVEFAIKHMGIATVRGSFGEFAGTLEIGDGTARAFGTVDVASITTGEDARDTHLKSADFFDAEKFPQLQFESTAIEALDDEEFRITGNLTMHGITNEIVLHAEYQGTDIDPWGGTRIGLEVTGQLNRSEWDMKFNQMLGSGNLMVADKVKLEIDISAVKQES